MTRFPHPTRPPQTQEARPRQLFKAYPLGYIHIDFAEVWTDQGKLYLFVAIDRVSKFASAELHERATHRTAADFLRRLIAHVPYTIHAVLPTTAFSSQRRGADGPSRRSAS